MTRIAIAALLAALTAFSASVSARADEKAPVDIVAKDTLLLFVKACVDTLAQQKQVAAAVDAAGAVKIPQAGAVEIGGGVAGSLAWSLKTPSGGQAIVGWRPPARCSVFVHQVDTHALQDELVEVMEGIARDRNLKVRLEHHDVTQNPDGKHETTQFLMFLPNDVDATIDLTTIPGDKAQVQGTLVMTVLAGKH